MSPSYNTEVESPVAVTVHPSCFPDRTRAAYLESFRTRRMNHRFHYESEKQAQQWLALHEAYSPARTDDDCLKTYERAFSETAKIIPAKNTALVSLGCGGGQKDLSLLKALKSSHYFPSDVSLPLALTAHARATKTLPITSTPFLIDLPAAPDLGPFLDTITPSETTRIIAFFGMLPNFEPAEVLPILSAALRPGDFLIASANLAPGPDYRAGVQKILPLYDNPLTRRWLATSLTDAGLELSPNEIQFTIAEVNNLLRIEAQHRFTTPQQIRLDHETFTYAPNDPFRLFYSYRHTPNLLRALFQKHQLQITYQWITSSAEEGIFFAEKSPT